MIPRRAWAQSLCRLSLASAIAPSVFAQSASPAATPESRRYDEELIGGSITDVPGIKVGHCTLKERPTGCTVVLCENGAVCSVDVRGAAPGTRETDLLNPVNAVQKVQAVVLSGGSAYGLDTATGVMRYLEERKLGFPIGASGVVPIVPAAILMDLGVGDFKIRPNAESGYFACLAAHSGAVPEGNVGAGAGATVGKLFGAPFAMKAGLGSASVHVGDTGIIVGAMVAVNAVGDIYHPQSNRILAGARAADGKGFRNSMSALLAGHHALAAPGAHTTLGVIATNASMTKAEMNKIAQMAHDGLARGISPIHTMWDGDTVFALSSGTLEAKADVSVVGAIAAYAMSHAIARAAISATSLPEFHLPAWRDYTLNQHP